LVFSYVEYRLTNHAIKRWYERVNTQNKQISYYNSIKGICSNGRIIIDNHETEEGTFRYILSNDCNYVIVAKKINDSQFLVLTILTYEQFKKTESQLF
jgi:hypothetical protein